MPPGQAAPFSSTGRLLCFSFSPQVRLMLAPAGLPESFYGAERLGVVPVPVTAPAPLIRYHRRHHRNRVSCAGADDGLQR